MKLFHKVEQMCLEDKTTFSYARALAKIQKFLFLMIVLALDFKTDAILRKELSQLMEKSNTV